MSRMIWQLVGTLFLTALILHYLPWLLLILGAYAAYRYGWPALQREHAQHQARVQAELRRRHAIAARADLQHNQVMSGDEHGLWGSAYADMRRYEDLLTPKMPTR